MGSWVPGPILGGWGDRRLAMGPMDAGPKGATRSGFKIVSKLMSDLGIDGAGPCLGSAMVGWNRFAMGWVWDI